MSAAIIIAAWVGLAPPAPSNPDAMQWEELDDPDAPAPAEATPPVEAAPPAEATPPAEASPPEGSPEGEVPPTEAAPAEPSPTEASPAPVLPPRQPEPEPAAVEFTPTEPKSEIAELQPPGDSEGRRKPDSLYGRFWAGPVIGAGGSLFAIGASATYFVIPHIGLGAELVNVFSWDPQGSYYEFQLTPQATFLMLPRRRLSPLFWGGFGLDTFNKGLGTYGRWSAGGGLIMLLGRRFMLTVGVEVDGRVPTRKWNQTFTCGPVRGNCTMGIGPALGISIPFG
ncbi:MAG: hypothetical protein ACRBN8_20075 [Nannocystales bacterium]